MLFSDKLFSALQPEIIEELIDDVNRPLKFQHRTDSVSPKKTSLSIVVNTVTEGAETDALGFYLQPKKSVSSKPSSEAEKRDEVVDKAAELKNLSDQIVKNIQIVSSISTFTKLCGKINLIFYKRVMQFCGEK